LVYRVPGLVQKENGENIDRGLVERVWKRYKKLEHDMAQLCLGSTQACNSTTIADFVEREKPRLLQEFADSERDDVCRALNLMLNYCRFMNGDDLFKVSATLSGQYKVFGGDEMVFGGGYSGFVDNLKQEIPARVFRFEAAVTRICWGDGGKVKVACRNGDVYTADHVVVTCSLGHLKHNHKQLFDPPLPEFKVGAIDRTGFGRVNKLFLYFDKPLPKNGVDLAWDKLGDPHAASTCAAWTNDIMGFEIVHTNPHVFGGAFAGRGAEIMEGLTDDEVATACTDTLRKFMRDPTIQRPSKVLRSRWISDPLFRGSYSYLSNSSCPNDMADLAAPLPTQGPPRLMFAGEATHPDYFSTIHGAYLTGVRESQRLAQLYSAVPKSKY
jgi:hypothetical protein